MIESLTATLLPDELPLRKVTIEFVDTLDDVLRFKDWVFNQTRGRTILAVDTESAGLDPYAPNKRIRLAQFGTENEAWVINCEKWPGIAQYVLENYTATPMAFHNIAFDYPYIKACWPDIRFPWERMHDTMLYTQLHDNEVSAALKNVTESLFGTDATIGQRALQAAMTANGWTWDTVPMSCASYTVYSGGDVILTARLWKRLEHIHSGPYKHLAEMEMRTARICADMTIRGMRVDRDYCRTEGSRLHDYVRQVDETLRDHMGINPGSPTQLANYFIGQGATLTERTASGQYKMDKEILTRLAAQGFEVAQGILDMRKAHKLATTYFDNLLEYSDNRDSVIHPKIKTIAARTGRMSVTEPALQTLPSKNSLVRGAFLPSPGESLVTCDFSQIELRLTAHISGDPALLGAFVDCDDTGEDFFTRIGKDLYGPDFEKADKRRTLIKNVIYGCLPTGTSRILTRRGLLSAGEVRVGDETIGFNPATGQSEWTPITHIQVYDDAPVISIMNGKRQFDATGEHRWVSERRSRLSGGETRWDHQIITTDEFIAAPSDTRLVLARVAVTEKAPLEDDMVRALGWALSDGTVYQRGKSAMTIRQSNKKYADEIRQFMQNIPHRVSEASPGYFVWHIPFRTAREIMKAAGVLGELPSAAAFATRFDAAQRALLLEAMQKADGVPFNKSNEWTHELYRTLMYLQGSSTHTTWSEPDSAWTRRRRGRTHERTHHFTRQRLKTASAGRTQVWCPTTELGTWTAEQNGELFLTGNSTYGAGVPKMAESAKVPLEVMQPIADNIFSRFHGIKGIQEMAIAEARTNERADGRPYIHTMTGRRLFVDPGLIYTAANYKIQALAADLMKKALIRLDNAGLGPYMLLPIHDEVVMSVPTGDVYDVKQMVREAMEITTDMGFAIKIPAEPEGPFERWQAK